MDARPAPSTIGGCESTDGAWILAVEEKDLIGWAVTGGLGLLGLVLNWRTRQDVKRRERAQTEAVWSLRMSADPTLPGDTVFELKLRDAAAQRLRLLKITVVKPRDAEIAHTEWRNGGLGEGGMYIPRAFGTGLDVNCDLDPATLFVPISGSQFTSFEVSFFARRPRRTGRPVDASRLVVRLDLEGVTARAERKTMTVRSETIDWARAHALEDEVL